LGSKIKIIKLEDVMNLLELESLEVKAHSKKAKNHGSCCVCHECGHWHDECVCEHNYLIGEISKVIIDDAVDEKLPVTDALSQVTTEMEEL